MTSSSTLFGSAGGLANSRQPPNLLSTNTSGLFSSAPQASAQAANTAPLFASQQSNQQASNPSAAFGQGFGQLVGAPEQPTSQATQPAFFNSLLERGKKRPLSAAGQSSTFESLPSLQLGLDDIRRKARELGTGGLKCSRQDEESTKAHYLFAASGISPSRALRDLKQLDSQASVSFPLPRDLESFDPDNQKFLKNIQQRGRLVMVEEGLARAQKDFDAFLDEKVDLDWEEQRRRIFQHFGLSQKDEATGDRPNPKVRSSFGRPTKHPAQYSPRQDLPSASGRSVFGRSGLGKSIIGVPGPALTSRQLFDGPGKQNEDIRSQSSDFRFVREKMGYYADKVQRLNSARLRGQPFPILYEFSEVERHGGMDVCRQLYDAYQALINIVAENRDVTDLSDSAALKERQFAGQYLNETSYSRQAVNLRRRIIEGSRSFLESQFYKEVESAISKNPREAQLGGVPSVANKIRAYIRLRAARKDLAPDGTELQMVGQDYCWILIFFLLRCGFVTEAAEYVSQDPGFRSMDHKFVTYMTTYARNRRLPRDLQQKINGEYQQRYRNAPDNTVDPYRMACYKVIGRCDLTRRRLDSIDQSVEDWMWLQFSLAREDDRSEEIAGEVFGLEDIQTDIAEIGQRLFTKGRENSTAYGTYFLLQILGGMFEQAVSYLGSYAPITAVHFAIALAYYGLLRVSDFYASDEEILSFTVKQYPQINFCYLITQYTREFRAGFVEAAIDYFTLICLNADLPGSLGKSHATVCHEALREFILETRDFAKLLGDIRSDGTRIKGVIEQRLGLIHLVDKKEFLRVITVQAAAIADDKGHTADAILLYHLAEDYDRVVEIINRVLADAVAVELGEGLPKMQPLRPRTDTEQPEMEPSSSLSLIAADNPVILAKNMIRLYNANALYYQRIRPANRDACGLLLRMVEAKTQVEAGNWASALDAINELNLLPLRARGSVPVIRGVAQAFSMLPSVVSRNIGSMVMWSLACIGNERERLISSLYENEMRKGLADELLTMAKDLMVFSGMIKYKLPPRVYESLARAGTEIGAY